MSLHPETDVIHIAEGASPDATPLTTPIYATSTFVFANAAELEAYQQGRGGKYIYSRYANPTVQAVEEKLAALEGGGGAILTSSGMAATATALFGLLSAGDEVVCSAAIYGGTLQLIASFLSRFGVTARFASLDDLAHPARAIGPKTKVVWFESPINPTLRCVDIRRVAEACRACGVLSVVDNTFASPVNQQPLALGADLVMHSATKYLNGHSDVTAGALVGSAEMIARLHSGPEAVRRRARAGLGVRARARAEDPARARDAAERERGARRRVAGGGPPRDARCSIPGLPSDPDHAIARRQMSGFGGMVTFEVASYAAACGVFDRLRVVQRAASLGGVESLCSLPVLTSQYGFSDEQLAAAGVTRGMIRLSIGLEHPDDLIADLDQSLQ